MHKRTCILILIMQTVAVLVLAVTAASANFWIQSNRKPTYGLKSAYGFISLHTSLPPEKKWKAGLRKQFFQTLNGKKATVVLVDNSTPGIGLYDTRGTYPDVAAAAGGLFTSVDPGSDAILTAKGLPADEAARKQNGILYSHGRALKVRGQCPTDVLFPDSGHTYLYPLVSSWDFSGNYYIISDSPGLAEQLAEVLRRANYSEAAVTYCGAPGAQTADFWKTLSYLSSQRYFPVFVFGLLILYFQYGLFFSFFVHSRKRTLAIHLRFGATNGRLLRYFSRWMLPCCMTGPFLGVLGYQLLAGTVFRQKILTLPLPWLIGTALIHGALTYFIFAVALCRRKGATHFPKSRFSRKGAEAP
jgi:hypothetical protein